MKNIKQLLLLMLLSFTSLTYAQQNDSLQVIGDFINICNSYKQQSMHLEVAFERTANVVTDKEDTVNILAEFYIQPQHAYIRFGEIEQIVDDSVAVLISNQMQSMLVYPNAAAVTAHMNSMMSLPLQDSVVSGIAKKFTALVYEDDSTNTILLCSRKPLAGTLLAKDEVELEYSTTSRLPLKVRTLTRKLIPLSLGEYDALSGKPGIKEKLLVIDSENRYVIKELSSLFIFHTIDYNNTQPPVSTNERIIKTGPGKYLPVEAYKTYSVRTFN